jgi:DnaJ domain
MSTESDWQRRRQQEWDERHRPWAKEQREREEREGTDYWKATQPKTQSFFDWSESERAAEEARRGREEMNRLLEDHVAQMGGSGSIPPCLVTLGLGRDADLEQVKASFRRLALVHHPDKGGEAAEFQRIKRAYDQALAYLRRRRKV